MTTITIRAEFAEAARDKLTKLQTKAAGYGQVISFEFAEPAPYKRKVTDWSGKQVTVTDWFVDVTVAGEAPRIGDHTLMARLTREAGGVIVDKVPGVEDSVGELGRAWAGNCEHCGHARQRSHGFIVRSGDKLLVVGRTCLRDYLGIDTPEKALWVFTFVRTLETMGEEDGWDLGGSSDWSKMTKTLLAATSGAIDLWGWAPKSGGADYDDTTAGRVALLSRPLRYLKGDDLKNYHRLAEELRVNAEKHYARADAVIAWAETIEPGKSDYLHNLKLLLATPWVKDKRAGYVCSAIPAYERAEGRKLEAERRAKEQGERPASQHVGQPGERITVEAVVEYIRALPGDFGDASVYTFMTDKGEKLSWITSASGVSVAEIGRGDRVKLTGTVRKDGGHSEYNGVKETRLTRCKLEKVAKLEAAA